MWSQKSIRGALCPLRTRLGVAQGTVLNTPSHGQDSLSLWRSLSPRSLPSHGDTLQGLSLSLHVPALQDSEIFIQTLALE